MQAVHNRFNLDLRAGVPLGTRAESRAARPRCPRWSRRGPDPRAAEAARTAGTPTPGRRWTRPTGSAPAAPRDGETQPLAVAGNMKLGQYI